MVPPDNVSDCIRTALHICRFFCCPGQVAGEVLDLLHEMNHTLLILFG